MHCVEGFRFANDDYLRAICNDDFVELMFSGWMTIQAFAGQYQCAEFLARPAAPAVKEAKVRVISVPESRQEYMELKKQEKALSAKVVRLKALAKMHQHH